MSLSRLSRKIRLTAEDVWRSLSPESAATKAAPALVQLEDRVLFSATALAAEVLTDATAGRGAELLQTADFVPVSNAPISENAGVTLEGSHAHAADTRHELVFVDKGVNNVQLLIDDLLNNADRGVHVEVHVLEADRDGVEQISEVLARHDDVAAVHLVSHGSEGQVKLGKSWLSISNVDGYAGEIAAWHHALRDGADLLIYGCNLASTEDGKSLAEALGAVRLRCRSQRGWHG